MRGGSFGSDPSGAGHCRDCDDLLGEGREPAQRHSCGGHDWDMRRDGGHHGPLVVVEAAGEGLRAAGDLRRRAGAGGCRWARAG